MTRMHRLATLALFVGTLTYGGPSRGAEDPVAAADAALHGWNVAEARRALERAGNSLAAEVKRGALEVYESKYVEAEQRLAALVASGRLQTQSSLEQEAQYYLGLARGSQRALGNATPVRSADGLTEIVFADEKDQILAPYLIDAMATARAALSQDLGIEPDGPVRFEILDDPLKLAMVTPLTVENIRTTGTVGVTKYRRIMMISPRVMLYGYGWLDTAVHEYVHYLLTLRTANRAPVWLQEGLAKLLETRWRDGDPYALDPGVAYRLHQAIVKDDLVTFEEMYPSIAMLPSAERAALAYAEVQTMLGLVRERRGTQGISILLDKVESGADAQAALEAAWGASFEAFYSEWKRVMKSRTARAEKGELDVPVFKDENGEQPDDKQPKAGGEPLADIFSHFGGGKARQHARLGTLLQVRGHQAAAAAQYEKARAADSRARKDETLARRLGRLYVELEAFDKAVPLLEQAAAAEPEDANLAAAQGRALLRVGRKAEAKAAIGRAVRVNPFIPTIHCDLSELATDPAVQKRESALCRND